MELGFTGFETVSLDGIISATWRAPDITDASATLAGQLYAVWSYGQPSQAVLTGDVDASWSTGGGVVGGGLLLNGTIDAIWYGPQPAASAVLPSVWTGKWVGPPQAARESCLTGDGTAPTDVGDAGSGTGSGALMF